MQKKAGLGVDAEIPGHLKGQPLYTETWCTLCLSFPEVKSQGGSLAWAMWS